ncbi:MAG: hypothetical protein ABEI11_00455 [Haloarculaceae archaeon]
MTRDTDGRDEGDRRSEAERLREAVQGFLDDVDRTYGEYDRGYADADATLRMLRSHVDALREEFDE